MYSIVTRWDASSISVVVSASRRIILSRRLLPGHAPKKQSALLCLTPLGTLPADQAILDASAEPIASRNTSTRAFRAASRSMLEKMTRDWGRGLTPPGLPVCSHESIHET